MIILNIENNLTTYTVNKRELIATKLETTIKFLGITIGRKKDIQLFGFDALSKNGVKK